MRENNFGEGSTSAPNAGEGENLPTISKTRIGHVITLRAGRGGGGGGGGVGERPPVCHVITPPGKPTTGAVT